MWLINFHIAFSTLLLAAEIGIYCMFRKKIKRKVGGIKTKKTGRLNCAASRIKLLLFLFIPGVNIIALLSLLIVITADKNELEMLYHYGEEQGDDQ